jgi:hypothetical protein
MVITSWPLGTRRRVSTEGTVTVSAATKFSEVRRAPQAVHVAAAFPSDSRGTALPCPAIELGEVEPSFSELMPEFVFDRVVVDGAWLPLARSGTACRAPTEEMLAGVSSPQSGQT